MTHKVNKKLKSTKENFNVHQAKALRHAQKEEKKSRYGLSQF